MILRVIGLLTLAVVCSVAAIIYSVVQTVAHQRPIVPGEPTVYGRPIDCKGWRHNPDNSWTQTKMIISGSDFKTGFSVMMGNTIKDTGETRTLDRLCRSI